MNKTKLTRSKSECFRRTAMFAIAVGKALDGVPAGEQVVFTCPICSSDATAYKAENGHKSARCDNCDHTIRQ